MYFGVIFFLFVDFLEIVVRTCSFEFKLYIVCIVVRNGRFHALNCGKILVFFMLFGNILYRILVIWFFYV
jgi:hypothetical protein